MKKSISIAFVYMLSFGLMLAGCETEEIVETPNVVPLEIPNLDDRVEKYFEDSLAVKDLEGSLLNGAAIGYYENGNPQIQASFLDGMPHGELIRYHENGNMEFKISFDNGTPIGEQRMYYKTGQLMSSLPIHDGKYHGVGEFFDENGYLYGQIEYQMGLRHGSAKDFDEAGEVTSWKIYEEDKLVEIVK